MRPAEGPTRADWEQRWQTDDTPWDMGGATPALVDWSRDRDLNGLRILVPGAGRGYDAHFLTKQGAHVVAVDISAGALAAAKRSHPQSKVQWLQADVTQLPPGPSYDLVWEYTCFCALNPDLRKAYFQSLTAVLKPAGRYFGMVFEQVPDPDDGPPFAICVDALRQLLRDHFGEPSLEPATARSVKARRGNEIWFDVVKR